VEKVSFEPGMKRWTCDGGWEWWAGGRWIRECPSCRVWHGNVNRHRDATPTL